MNMEQNTTIYVSNTKNNNDRKNKINELKEIEDRAKKLREEVFSGTVERYVSSIQTFFKLPKNLVATIITFLKNADENNIVNATNDLKNILINEAGVCGKTLASRISIMIRYGILEKTPKIEHFKISEFFFGEGWKSLITRDKLKLHIESTASGYIIQTSFSNDKKHICESAIKL